jgi:glycosyltransferase involved in cell wall biosynthesis
MGIRVRHQAREVNIFLFAIGARDRASSRLRVWDHVGPLAAQGNQVRVDSLVSVGANTLSARLAARIAGRLPAWIANFFWADAVVLQESLLLWPLALIKNLGKRRQIMFDFSDPVDRHGAGWKGRLRRTAFDMIVRHADVVMVENRSYIDLLRDRANVRAHFYGPIDASRYAAARARLAPRPASAPIRIGWTGSPGTYRFIAPLMRIIDGIAKDHPIEVMLIGVSAIDHIFRHAQLTLVPWNEDSEYTVVPSFDLGLFRLEDTEDAKWRGAGKLFIYMAAGVPFVASDFGIAHDLMVESQVGFGVADDAAWSSVLHCAITNHAARRSMVEQSLTFADAHLSYDTYRRHLMTNLRVAPPQGFQP